MGTDLGRKSFVIGLGLAMLLSAFVVGAANVNDNIIPENDLFTGPLSIDSVDIQLSDVALSNSNPTQYDEITIEATITGDQSVSDEWEKYGVVVDIGGWGQDERVGKASVLKMDNGTYIMYYQGNTPDADVHNYRIFRAWSFDGINWNKECLVLDNNLDQYSDNGVMHPNVLIDDNGLYHMWYVGYSNEGSNRARILYATSIDGYNWVPQGLQIDYGDSYAQDGVVSPCVLPIGDGYRMWYSGINWNPLEGQICHASKSSEASPWIKEGIVLDNGGPYDPTFAKDSSVIYNGTGYEMFYTGRDSNYNSMILHASSSDGYNWVKDNIEIEPTLVEEGAWIELGCAMLEDDGTYKMWYSAYTDTWRILYAEKSPAEPALDAYCTVSFYIDSIAEENLLERQFNVFVPANGETTVQFDWMADIPGNHNIIVDVSDVNPQDNNLVNNVAQCAITVDEIEIPLEVDLSIYDQDITFSNPIPQTGETVNIQAVIHGDPDQASELVREGIILDIGGTGQDLHVLSPNVIQMDDGSYVMWYTGDGDDGLTYRHRIFRAISPDGITWTKTGMVLDYGGSQEENGVLYPFVYIDTDGSYQMWYAGINTGNHASIFTAISNDGITWTKLGQEIAYGSAAEPSGASAPYVYYDGTQWHMWYVGVFWGSPNECKISHAHKATLNDSWIKDGVVLDNDGPYDYPSASIPHVISTANGYEMYYTGYVPYTGPSRILHATSNDGLTWEKNGIALEGELPEELNSIAGADVKYDNGVTKYWYFGYDGSNQRIFYAEEVPAKQGLDATCTVSFYLDETIPENLIYQEPNVFVPGGGETTVSFNWIPEITGTHDILVEVTETDPSDYDLSNNIAQSSIDIQEQIITFATATGPQGAHHDPNITITYEWTGNPEAVDMYYSSNVGSDWTYLGTDFTIDGFFSWTPENNPGPKPSKYYWIANAVNGTDDIGVPPNDTPPEAGPFNWKTFDVKLDSGDKGLGDIGWHFISVPLGVSGELSAIFDDSKWGDGGTTWDCIKWYDPTDDKDPWKTYRVGASTNDLFDYSNGMGLWIHITSNNGDGFLTTGEGVEVTSTAIQLSAGWNMVGYPTYCDTKTVGEVFWKTGADRIEIFDPTKPYLINEVEPSHIMKPGAGYWVHVPADTVWVVDW